jgi:hypothetical protein
MCKSHLITEAGLEYYGNTKEELQKETPDKERVKTLLFLIDLGLFPCGL